MHYINCKLKLLLVKNLLLQNLVISYLCAHDKSSFFDKEKPICCSTAPSIFQLWSHKRRLDRANRKK